MSDHGVALPREEPDDAAHDAVRDALPALLHGRVTASARAELDAHLATCAACDAELRTIAAVHAVYATPSPPIAVDRIAAAVRARTMAPAAFSFDAGAPSPSRAARRLAIPVDRPRVRARRGTVRALAARALLAIGSGAMLVSRSPTSPVHGARGVAMPVAAGMTAGANGSLLGASFSDLSDTELAAVVAAVDDPASPTPAAEPAPVSPNVLVPDGE